MKSKEIRKKFLNFFKEKGHKIIPSSSLLPDDKTVLFTTAGMQQFTLYLQGERDPMAEFGTRHLASCQKCFRTGDIEEVGDDTHHTFFEMLGNWSVGQDPKKGYFKEGAIKYALEFFTKELGFDKDKIWTTIFKGEKGISKDEEAKRIWQKNGIPGKRIKEFGMGDNFWGPVGKTGPCGPCSEIFYDRGEEFGCEGKNCGPNCEDCKRFVELWNLVFMEYFKDQNGKYNLLSQKNVDTGIGFERITALLQKKPSAYETDLFWPVILELEKISSQKYEKEKRIFRILADHIRGIVFLIADGVTPSNVEQGYILRRLLRRIISFGKLHRLNLPDNFSIPLAKKIIEIYKDVYPEIESKEIDVLTIIQKEEEKFSKALEKGIKEYEKVTRDGQLTAKEAFRLHDTYSLPLVISLELARGDNININEERFDKEYKEALKKHQEVSRAGAEKKFGGIGEGATSEAIKLHTATHLVHQALRDILGSNVKQKGSDITSQRLRFDFSHPQRLSQEEIKEVEDLVNQKIKEDLKVEKKEMSFKEAVELGALAFFRDKYPERVTVYSAREKSGKVFSREVCGGPHIKSTGKLGSFKIIKEESAGAGVRRIRAILE